jgi:RND family efflux transporter MFP subunit
MAEEENEQAPKGGKWWITLLGSVLLVALSWYLIRLIDHTEPEAERIQAAKRTAMLVQVMAAEKGEFQPRIEALGEVLAAREVALGSRVSGSVIDRSESFVDGGLVRKDEILVQLDPTDYQKILERRQGEHQQALADLKLEEGQGKIAELDLELLEESLEVKDKELALRGPQLQSARAAVELTAVAVEEARLNLARTEVRAPFDAQIMSRNVEVGAQIPSGFEIAQLVGMEEYWVVATVPMTSLRYVGFSTRENPSLAEIRDSNAWGSEVVRTGKVARLLGALDRDTRLARVVISVKDPLAREGDLPVLILGSLLDVVILGDPISNVVRLPREYLRKNDTVWVNEDGKLSIRQAEIAFRDKDFAYLSKGVEAGEQIVTTSLASVTEGAALRTKPSDNE